MPRCNYPAILINSKCRERVLHSKVPGGSQAGLQMGTRSGSREQNGADGGQVGLDAQHSYSRVPVGVPRAVLKSNLGISS